MKKILTLTASLMAISACSPQREDQYPSYRADTYQEAVPTVSASEQAEFEKRQAEALAVEKIRNTDPKINWMKIGISTDEFSESLSVTIHKTHEECVAASVSEDNECAPIAALPQSYWDADGEQHD